MLEQFMIQDLPQVMEIMMANLVKELKKELEEQGHKLSGRLINSIDFKVTLNPFGIQGDVYFLPYGKILETGVKPARIPFSGTRKGGGRGSSKYIQALIGFFQDRGFPERKAKGLAFATAYTHKREGMPAQGSKRFSSTGERTGFITRVVEREQPKIVATFQRLAADKIQVRLLNIASALQAA